MIPSDFVVRTESTAVVSPVNMRAIRALMDAAFGGDFSDEDWEHTIGGTHVIAMMGDRIVSHAAVVPRILEAGGQPFSTGYVEGVVTSPESEGKGYGTAVIRACNEVIMKGFELGALSTGLHDFYARIGWERWQGATGVRTAVGVDLTPDEDDGIMILRTSATETLDPGATLTCEWRPGDVW